MAEVVGPGIHREACGCEQIAAWRRWLLRSGAASVRSEQALVFVEEKFGHFGPEG